MTAPSSGNAGVDDPRVRSALPPELRLSHDVARNLAHLGPEQRADAVATHLRKFWAPRMRRALVAFVDAGDPRVDPVVAEAVRRYLAGDLDRAEVAEPSGG